MTREEAVIVLKGLMKNPLFSEVHKVAFNIAINDIKQRHDWDINNLILINKENYEPTEQEPVLDKIRAEIEEYKSRQLTLAISVDDLEKGKQIALEYVLAVLNKYKAESEAENG